MSNTTEDGPMLGASLPCINRSMIRPRDLIASFRKCKGNAQRMSLIMSWRRSQHSTQCRKLHKKKGLASVMTATNGSGQRQRGISRWRGLGDTSDDMRLGCLGPHLKVNSEPETIYRTLGGVETQAG